MQSNLEKLKEIQIEDLIWCIYIVLILLSIYSNHFEKRYYLYNDIKSKEDYRKLNIFIFSVAVIIYLYFVSDGYKSLINSKTPKAKDLNTLNFTASALILVAGLIFLYIAINDKDLNTEIALT